MWTERSLERRQRRRASAGLHKRAYGFLPLVWSGVALVLAGAALLGWATGPEWLRGFGHDRYPAWPLTLVVDLGLAASVMAVARRREGIALLLLLPAVVVGSGAALEYAGYSAFGLDRLLFAREVAATGLPAPGRPNAVATLSMILLAVGVLLSTRQGRSSDLTVLLIGSIVVALAGLALTVIFLPYELFPQQARFAGSLPTALILLMLALALLSNGLTAGAATGGALSLRERVTAAVAATMIVVAPPLLAHFTGFLGQGGASPVPAVLLASALNVPVVVLVLGAALHLLRQEREALVATERRLSLATEAHHVSIFSWDLERDIVRWSEDAEIRFGLEPGTITNFATWARHVPAADVTTIQREMAAAADRKEARFPFRYRFTRPDGQTRQIEGSAHLLYNDQGRLESTIGVNVDVTDFERDKAQLQSILETVPDGMIVIDESGTVQRFSSAAVRMFGWTEAEMVGRNIAALMPDAQAAGHDGYLRRYLDGGKPRVIGATRQLRGRRKNGDTFPMEANVGETRVAGERLFTGFVKDITHQVETARRLEVLRTEYMHADRATAMGEIAAGLAHELNQPLAAAATYLSVAEITAGTGGDQSTAAMAAARGEMLRAGLIIRRLRDFLAKNEVDVARHSLMEIVADAVELALVGHDRSRFEITVDVPGELAVLADRVQIQQVLVNLLRNAAEAIVSTRQGHVTIAGRALDEGMVEVEVCDDGPGLPLTILSRLSQPFVSTKGRAGMGVGLSICRRIIEAHDGSFVARNRPAGGACVRFTIPEAGPAMEQA